MRRTTLAEPVIPFSPTQIEAGAEHPPAQKRSKKSNAQFHRAGKWKEWNHKVGWVDQKAYSNEGDACDEPNRPVSSAWWHE
jgi:hypothetical protein